MVRKNSRSRDDQRDLSFFFFFFFFSLFSFFSFFEKSEPRDGTRFPVGSDQKTRKSLYNNWQNLITSFIICDTSSIALNEKVFNEVDRQKLLSWKDVEKFQWVMDLNVGPIFCASFPYQKCQCMRSSISMRLQNFVTMWNYQNFVPLIIMYNEWRKIVVFLVVSLPHLLWCLFRVYCRVVFVSLSRRCQRKRIWGIRSTNFVKRVIFYQQFVWRYG